jgi:hypothetical protein
MAALLALAVAAALLVVLHGSAQTPVTPAPARTVATHTGPVASPASYEVSVSRTPVTKPLPGDFLGLAVEYNTIPQWVGSGTGSGAVNPPLVQLIRNLQPTGHPVIRIGGQSTDRSWWPVKGLARPLGVTYVLNKAWTKAAHALASTLDARLMLGLNLEANRTRIPSQEARHLLGGIGSRYVKSLQLGNEPELYRNTPWYRVSRGKPIPWYSKTGTRVFARAPGYSADDFASEFSRIKPLLPDVPLAGPETGNADWMQDFLQFLSPHSQLRMLTFHDYGNNGCFKTPSESLYPTIPHLLALDASRDLLDGSAPFVSQAHHDGATFRIDEMGSVTCNGRAGVSDTMASALWVIDALFSVANSGVDGVNLHSYPGSVNGLFDFAQSKDGQWTATVHPLYYGTLMFARAAPPGSRQLHTSTGDQSQIRSWATIGADHRVRVMLINTGQSRRQDTRVVIHAPAHYGSRPAAIQRLRAHSVAATHGVTLGGQAMDRTTTGTLGAPVTETATPRSGTYTVALPAFSAALLVLDRH